MTEHTLRICARALRELRAQVPFELGTVWVQTEAGTVPAAHVGRPFDLLEGIPFQTGTGLRSWILRTGRSVRIPSKGRGLRAGGLRGVLAIPAEYAGRRVAVVVLGRTETAFTEAEEHAVRRAAQALARSLLEEVRDA